MKVIIKASVTLTGNYGINFMNVELNEQDLINLIKEKALNHFTEGYYDEVECDKIDSVSTEY